ncbi:VanZ family protein [Mucilaginibacter sp. KACC 22063]|uniref:VanZ family protein n=1 Tax=Mucilaginibacter sp. KACC 22063 TaxID=3025666 RepID=UPI002366499B|nr:VanZ family protein [Mucilaginibacter sp. KACC 22063]WDF55540.1 VanZ family protein [Mucilaginibacter sp. KACC 22063]
MCSIKMGKVGESPLFFQGFDKMVHCGFFFVFTVLASNGYTRQSGKVTFTNTLAIMFIAIMFGGLIEVMQTYLFPWRSGDWNDLFADTVGVGMATFCILVINSAIKYEKA